MSVYVTDSSGNPVTVRKRNTTPTLLVQADATNVLLQSIVMMLTKIRKQLQEGREL